MVNVTVIGTAGMLPVYGRFLSSFHVAVEGHGILVDCGENTQVGCARQGVSLLSINTILITHCHLDHVLGLPGLIATMNEMKREKPLTIVCPVGTKRRLSSLVSSVLKTKFRILFWEISAGEELQFENCSVHAIECNHTVPCLGYCIEVKRRPALEIERLVLDGVPRDQWAVFQASGLYGAGQKYISGYRNGIKIVYATDTLITDDLVRGASNADLLVLEGACDKDSLRVKGGSFKHLTFEDAALVAKKAGAKELWLTHYGNWMRKPYNWEDAASSVFSNTFCAFDGLHRQLTFGADLPYDTVGELQLGDDAFLKLMTEWSILHRIRRSVRLRQGDLVIVHAHSQRSQYATIVARVEHVLLENFGEFTSKILELRLFGFQKEKGIL